ncbi:MAG: type II toxin-antitoxin system VapC family toxin [Candidatus Micrarchaeota archaeon]|nr:type II toxin-antitoxin system VapC family toxin [Candidatus Micrarchaeota archaeon]
MVCLDTNIIIDYLSGDEKVIALVMGYKGKENLSTTAITEYELLKHGGELKVEDAQRALRSFTVYDFTKDAARESAKIFKLLQARGKMVNENDILIAGIARVRHETLLTRDLKFKAMEDQDIKII